MTIIDLLLFFLLGLILEIAFFIFLKKYTFKKIVSQSLEKFLNQKNEKGEFYIYKAQKDGHIITYDFEDEKKLLEKQKEERRKKNFFFLPFRKKEPEIKRPDPEIQEANEIKENLNNKSIEDYNKRIESLERQEKEFKQMKELEEKLRELKRLEEEIKKEKENKEKNDSTDFIMIKSEENKDPVKNGN